MRRPRPFEPILPKLTASALGLKRYYTGEPCKNGHINFRFVSTGSCLDCCAASAARRTARNPELERQKNRTWVEKNREKIRSRTASWREQNKEKIRADKAKYHAENATKIVAKVTEWRRENPVKFKALATTCGHRRRARELGGKSHTAADRAAIMKRQKHRCAYCPANLKLVPIEWDHIIPLAKGGTNDRGNIQALCKKCNRSKGAKMPYEFAGRLL